MPYRFELATAADDADLRRILAATPMAGTVSLAFGREPSFFAAAEVEGRVRQVVAARDTDAGRLVGFGCRCVRSLYVNGTARDIGYLSTLRLLAKHRNRGLVARGYAFFKELHRDGLAPLYLTTIAEGNEVALRLLTSGRAGLPRYHFAGEYHTAAIPLNRAANGNQIAGLTIAPARTTDLPALVHFLNAEGPHRQFFPVVSEADFVPESGIFHGLRLQDLFLAWRGTEIVGTLGAWNQTGFRQTVVHGYGRALRWARPLVNGWAHLRGTPRLPAPGEHLHYLTGALPVVKDNDTEVFAALIQAVCDRTENGEALYLLIGLHADDPLRTVVSRVANRSYTTQLYLVCWEDGEKVRQALDGRVPYLELGTL
jgi:hypothetical protein